jgi:hypothetical protein
MNTKIDARRLANVAGSDAEGNCAVIKKDRGALHSIKMGVATAVLFASVGMATAQQRYPAGTQQYYSLSDPAQHAPSVSRSDYIRYDHSGTRSREGLGAIPRCSISRPEAGYPGEGACYYEYRRNGVRD